MRIPTDIEVYEQESEDSWSRNSSGNSEDLDETQVTSDLSITHNDRKSRAFYILFGFFGGAFGLHNAYAERQPYGLIQMVITLIAIPLCFVLIGFFILLIVQLWVLLELHFVASDGRGRKMV